MVISLINIPSNKRVPKVDIESFSLLPQEYSEANSQNVPKCWFCWPLYQERLLEETSSQAIIQGNLVLPKKDRPWSCQTRLLGSLKHKKEYLDEKFTLVTSCIQRYEFVRKKDGVKQLKVSMFFNDQQVQLLFPEKSPAPSHREPKNGLDTDCERRLACGWSQWTNKSIDDPGLQFSQGCQEKTTGCSNTPSCLRAFWLDSRAHTHP